MSGRFYGNEPWIKSYACRAERHWKGYRWVVFDTECKQWVVDVFWKRQNAFMLVDLSNACIGNMSPLFGVPTTQEARCYLWRSIIYIQRERGMKV